MNLKSNLDTTTRKNKGTQPPIFQILPKSEACSTVKNKELISKSLSSVVVVVIRQKSQEGQFLLDREKQLSFQNIPVCIQQNQKMKKSDTRISDIHVSSPFLDERLANFCIYGDQNLCSKRLQNLQISLIISNQNRTKGKKIFEKFCKQFMGDEPIKQFEKDDDFVHDHIKSIKEYCDETFFHKIVNRSLKKYSHPKEYIYLKFPVSTLSSAIKTLHKKTIDKMFQDKKHVTVFRGCVLSESQIQLLQGSIGTFIELLGFTSTSLEEQVGIRFCHKYNGNAILQIELAEENVGGQFDNGFSDVSIISSFPEKEVLFNIGNLFKVKSVQKDQCRNFVNSQNEIVFSMNVAVIRLQFGIPKIYEEKLEQSLPPKEKEIIQLCRLQKNIIANGINFGILLFYSCCYEEALDWFQENFHPNIPSPSEKQNMLFYAALSATLQGNVSTAIIYFQEYLSLKSTIEIDSLYNLFMRVLCKLSFYQDKVNLGSMFRKQFALEFIKNGESSPFPEPTFFTLYEEVSESVLVKTSKIPGKSCKVVGGGICGEKCRKAMYALINELLLKEIKCGKGQKGGKRD